MAHYNVEIDLRYVGAYRDKGNFRNRQSECQVCD